MKKNERLISALPLPITSFAQNDQNKQANVLSSYSDDACSFNVGMIPNFSGSANRVIQWC